MPTDDPGVARRAFFGRRKGHPLRPHHRALIETLLPRLALALDAPAPADLTQFFPLPVDGVRLEIGFGGGEHLVARAGENPDVGFIGCEPFVNGVAKLLAAVQGADLAWGLVAGCRAALLLSVS